MDDGNGCLLYTSDAADDLLCVDLGGRRIIKKKNNVTKQVICSSSNKNSIIMKTPRDNRDRYDYTKVTQ